MASRSAGATGTTGRSRQGGIASLGPGSPCSIEGIGIGEDEAAPGVFKYGLLGTKGFFLNGIDDVSVMALFFFMMVFMDTTATIPTGALAERWAWKNFCLYGLWVALPYCIYANWVWGGGWLAQMGIELGSAVMGQSTLLGRESYTDGWPHRPGRGHRSWRTHR